MCVKGVVYVFLFAFLNANGDADWIKRGEKRDGYAYLLGTVVQSHVRKSLLEKGYSAPSHTLQISCMPCVVDTR
jgi:hypothetical protein